MFNWGQHIKQLNRQQAQKVRNMVVLAIVCIMAAQGLIIHLLAFSFSAQQDFSEGISHTEQVLTSTQQAWKAKLKILLDFSTTHDNERVPAQSHLASVFNLFCNSIGIDVPTCRCVWMNIAHRFFYQNLYYHLLLPKIPHPPQSSQL